MKKRNKDETLRIEESLQNSEEMSFTSDDGSGIEEDKQLQANFSTACLEYDPTNILIDQALHSEFSRQVRKVWKMASCLYLEAAVDLVDFRSLTDEQKKVYDRLLLRALSQSGITKFREVMYRSDLARLELNLADFGNCGESLRKENLIKIVLSLSLKVLKRQFRQDKKVSKSHRTGYYVNKAKLNDTFYKEVMGEEPVNGDSSLLHQVVGGFTKGFFLRLVGANATAPKTGLINRLFWLLSTEKGRSLLLAEYSKGVESKLSAIFNIDQLIRESDNKLELSASEILEAIEERILTKGTKLPRSLIQLQLCIDLAQAKLLKLCNQFGLDVEKPK